MFVPPERSSAVLVMTSSKSVSICDRSHARRANSCKITVIQRGTPLWSPRFKGISSPSGTKFAHKKLENQCYHMVKIRSLYLTWASYRGVTLGHWRQTGGQHYDSYSTSLVLSRVWCDTALQTRYWRRPLTSGVHCTRNIRACWWRTFWTRAVNKTA